jgi:fructokinase
VKLSVEELAFLAGSPGGERAALDRLRQGSMRFLVVTDGARPIRWFTPDAMGSLLPFGVRAVDTTAAGDAFVGGMLHGLLGSGIDAQSLAAFADDDARRDSLLRFAAACGALAVTRAGSFAAMPTLAEVEAFLGQHA